MTALYEARLDSPTDEQFRVRRVEADSAEHARKIIELRELNRTSYSLLDRVPVRQISTRKHAKGVHATVNMDVFADSGLSGHDLLTFCERDHAIDGDGKAYGPNRAIKNHLQAHYQAEPYKIVSLEQFVPSVDQIIQELTWLQGNEDGWKRLLEQMKKKGLPLAAVTASLFGLTAQHMIDGSAAIAWTSATIKAALTTSSYSPNNDTHDFFNDVTNEITGTGYTAGGATLASATSTYDTATDQVRLDAADTTWTTSTLTARRAVVWNDTAGASSADPVMGWIDFGADVSTTAGTFQITYDTTGIINYDVT